jgi:hypothetical protein
VCVHGAWYRQQPLEGVLLERFRAATSPPMLDALTIAVMRRLEAAVQARDARSDAVKEEILRLEREAGNLARFLRGGESPTVREELTTIESALHGLRMELATLQSADRPALPSVSRARIQARVDEFAELIATDPVRARTEIRKHFEGDLELVPLASEESRRQVELRGRLKPASLLTMTDQEAGSPTIGCGGWI